MAEPEPSPRRATVVLGLALLLLVLHASLAWLLRPPSITTGHDDAVYLLLARGLRRLSYHDFWLVGAPREAQYPPLYPAALALAGTVFGDLLRVALALNVLCSTAALGIFFSLARRWSEPVALLGLAAGAVNPWLVRQVALVASEPLFMLCVALTLWWLAVPNPSSRTRSAALAAAIAASLTRSIGVALVAALLLQWLLERRFRLVLGSTLAGGLIVRDGRCHRPEHPGFAIAR